MSEVTDLVLPILQKIQADLAEVQRVQAEHSQKFEDIEIYLAYATGRFPEQGRCAERQVRNQGHQETA